MKKLLALGLIAVSSVAVLTGCSGTQGELLIYTARSEDQFDWIVDAYEAETGKDVIVEYLDEADIITRLRQESTAGVKTADLVFTKNTLLSRDNADLFEEFDTAIETADLVDDSYDSTRKFIATSIRYRVASYDEVNLDVTDITMKDLLTTHSNSLGMRNLNNAYLRSQVAGIYAAVAEGINTDWTSIEEFKTDFESAYAASKNLENTTDADFSKDRYIIGANIDALADYGLVNSYYYHNYVLDKFENIENANIIYPDQEVGAMGTWTDYVTASIVDGAENNANANSFIEFMLTDAIQERTANENGEFPVLLDYSDLDLELTLIRPTLTINQTVGMADISKHYQTTNLWLDTITA